MFNQVLTLVKELGRKCLARRTGPESSAEILIGTSQIPYSLNFAEPPPRHNARLDWRSAATTALVRNVRSDSAMFGAEDGL